MTKFRTKNSSPIKQGDVIRNVEMIENIKFDGKKVEIKRIVFPLSVVITQSCDLDGDYHYRWGKELSKTANKKLLSLLMLPLYNAEHLLIGKHFENLGVEMNTNFSKEAKKCIEQNKDPRYHYLEFPAEIPVVPQIIDFKHYFTVNAEILKQKKKRDFVCQIAELYREDLSLRFAGFLSRIGLPG